MKLALFGVGNAGIRLVDQLCASQRDRGVDFVDDRVLAFNTAATAGRAAPYIPAERHLLLGDTPPDIITESPSADDDEARRKIKPGAAGDPDLAATVARRELPEIRRQLDRIDDTDIGASLVVVGLGGGTGSGVGAVLVEELQAVYESPVYVLGVLPAASEPEERQLNAARAIRTLVPLSEAVLTVDNDAWHTGDGPVEDSYADINERIADRITALFGAGESDTAAASEVHMDPSDIRRTLATGGLASLGYAEFDLGRNSGGLLAWLRSLFGGGNDEEPQVDAATIKQLVSRTIESRLTLPCGVDSADRVLLVLSGPPGDLSRKGFETGRFLLEEETDTVDVLAGDEPIPGAGTISATVLLSNVTDVPRLEAIQERAVATLDDGSAAAATERQRSTPEPLDDAPDRPTTDLEGLGSDADPSGDD